MAFGYVGPPLDQTFEIIWKTEGATDALALYRLIRESGLTGKHTAVTNDCGATQRPSKENDWFAGKMKGATVYVVHDCDQPGQLGALGDGKRPGWCSAIARHANECRNVVLPYRIEESDGKDLRDWIGDQLEAGKERPAIYEELLAMAERSQAVEPWQGKQLPGETNEPNSPAGKLAAGDIDDDQLEVAIDDPKFLAITNLERYNELFGGTLRYHRETWWKYKSGVWREITADDLELRLRETIEDVFASEAKEKLAEWINKGDPEKPKPKKRKVTEATVKNAMRAMAAMPHVSLSSSLEMPCNTRDGSRPQWVSLQNGRLDLGEIVRSLKEAGKLPDNPLLPHTPEWFCATKLPYEFKTEFEPDENGDDSGCRNWLWFLNDVFEGDAEQIATLQKWFGYMLTPEMYLHKILMIIGPPRSGKGTIARTLTALIGSDSVASPSFNNLANDFATESLIGKTVAIIPDGRLPKNDDKQLLITERLLSISGEDAQLVNRKNRSMISARLPIRFTILSNNELSLDDPSGALASRLVFLKTPKGNLGNEDETLGDKILGELPAILNWAIAGRLLLERDGFKQPAGSKGLAESMEIESAPVKTFVRECCSLGPGKSVSMKQLHAQYVQWAEDTSARHHKANQFSRQLRAAFRSIGSERPRQDDGTRERHYTGIEIKPIEF